MFPRFLCKPLMENSVHVVTGQTALPVVIKMKSVWMQVSLHCGELSVHCHASWCRQVSNHILREHFDNLIQEGFQQLVMCPKLLECI